MANGTDKGLKIGENGEETNMLVSGKMGNIMGKELIRLLVDKNMLVNLKMVIFMVNILVPMLMTIITLE